MQLRQVRGLSAKYKDEIREEVRAFREECSTIQQVNYPAVKAWTREFEDQGKASKTIKKKLSKLSGFWRYLEELQMMKTNQKL